MRGSIQGPPKWKSWGYVVDAGYVDVSDGNGGTIRKRKQLTKRGFKRRADAERAMRKIMGAVEDGTYTRPSHETLNEYAPTWLASRTHLKESTVEWYSMLFDSYILPRLGHRRLSSIQGEDLTTLYAELQARGGAKNGQPLGKRSVTGVHVALSKALKDAVKLGKLPRNPADLSTLPRWEEEPDEDERELHTWTAEELGTFLRAAQGHALYHLWTLAATTGMRRGELLGLRWQDVNVDRMEIRIAQTVTSTPGRKAKGNATGVRFGPPKTKRSRRTIRVDENVMALLRSRRVEQNEQRLAAGPLWTDSGLVFTRPDGQVHHPDPVSKAFKRMAAKAGVPVLTLHALRHTWATLALERGVPLKTVSDVLGHSTYAVTADIYSHRVAALEHDAVSSVTAAIFGG